MKNSISFLAFCALVGYTAGSKLAPAPVEAYTTLSSSEKPEEGLTYADISCPSEADYQNLADGIRLMPVAGPSLDEQCDDGHKALLAKSLYLTKKLRFNLPQDWPEILKKNLSDPYKFIQDRSKKMTLDLSQSSSVAYNRVALQEIYLGGQYFTLSPLEGVTVLVHEARHSEPQANSHVVCTAGDIPRGQGACDLRFSMEDDAGAYAYGTLFSVALALYAEDISVADQELAMSSALLELGARFNEIPEVYAKKSDVLAVLSEDNQVYLVHPESGKTFALKIPFEEPQEFAERIEFSPSGNGLIVFSSNKRIYRWNAYAKSNLLYGDLYTKTTPVHDIFRLRIPFQDVTRNAVRLDNNVLEYVEFSPRQNKAVRSPYPLDRGRLTNPLPKSPFHRMFLATYDDSIYLTQDGKLYLAPHFGNEDVFNEHPDLQSAHGWQAGTGGVLYDSLYLIDKRGDLFYTYLDFEEGIDDISRVYKMETSARPSPGPLKKFAQGLDVEVGLTETGEIVVWHHTKNTNDFHRLTLPLKVKDVVLTHVTDMSEKIGPYEGKLSNFLGPKKNKNLPYNF